MAGLHRIVPTEFLEVVRGNDVITQQLEEQVSLTNRVLALERKIRQPGSAERRIAGKRLPWAEAKERFEEAQRYNYFLEGTGKEYYKSFRHLKRTARGMVDAGMMMQGEISRGNLVGATHAAKYAAQELGLAKMGKMISSVFPPIMIGQIIADATVRPIIDAMIKSYEFKKIFTQHLAKEADWRRSLMEIGADPAFTKQLTEGLYLESRKRLREEEKKKWFSPYKWLPWYDINKLSEETIKRDEEVISETRKHIDAVIEDPSLIGINPREVARKHYGKELWDLSKAKARELIVEQIKEYIDRSSLDEFNNTMGKKMKEAQEKEKAAKNFKENLDPVKVREERELVSLYAAHNKITEEKLLNWNRD